MNDAAPPNCASRALRRQWLAMFLLCLLVLLPTEFWCVHSAFETQGEVMQAMLSALFWLNVLWICVCWWSPRMALAGALALALAIVPYQVALLSRLTWLNNEIMSLVDARLRMRAEGKPIPATLDDYKFSDPAVKRFIHSYSVGEDGRDFSVAYLVVQPGITHSYSSKTGWFYYPD